MAARSSEVYLSTSREQNMAYSKNLKKLAKYLAYLLGRRPDEFGLVADSDGFIKIKEVLKALSEEKAWRHVTRASLNEILITLPDAPMEINTNQIRAINRSGLPQPEPDGSPPKLLFTAVRRKAYPRILQKGVAPSLYPGVLLAADRAMALRIGKRLDQSPVLLTINTDQARQRQTVFARYGSNLFLAAHLPPGCFTGTPLPKETKLPPKPSPDVPAKKPKTPGSFILDRQAAPLLPKRGRPKPKRNVVGWKETRKKQHKQNKKFDNPW
jgi:putative RNA 2'-phosphotransferase